MGSSGLQGDLRNEALILTAPDNRSVGRDNLEGGGDGGRIANHNRECDRIGHRHRHHLNDSALIGAGGGAVRRAGLALGVRAGGGMAAGGCSGDVNLWSGMGGDRQSSKDREQR